MSAPKGLAALLFRERRRLKLSLSEVGILAGVDRTLIWQLEKGKSPNPSILVLNGISVALSVHFHDVCDAALLDAKAARSNT